MIYPFSYNLGFLEKKKSNQHYNFKLLNIQKSQIWHTALFFSTLLEGNSSIAVRFQNILKKKCRNIPTQLTEWGP